MGSLDKQLVHTQDNCSGADATVAGGDASYSDGVIIDVGVLGETCVTIELNPFKPTTGACLFDWKRDGALLCGDVEVPLHYRDGR